MNNFLNKYFLPQLLMLGISIVNNVQILKNRMRGNIAFISGGSDPDEAKAMRIMSKYWSLSIVFSVGLTYQTTSGSKIYLRIFRSNNEPIFEALIDGPMVLGRLMPDNYMITATKDEITQTRYIQIVKDKPMHVIMSWAPSFT